MALPVAASPLPPDVATLHWAAITVRVGWTLRALGVKVGHDVLRDARDHVLFHLEPGTPPEQAEDRAGTLTHAFVHRALDRPLEDHWTLDSAMPLSPRWRVAVEEACTPLAAEVFHRHYGDGRPLDRIAGPLGVDRLTLEEVRGGLREMIRRTALADGLPLEEWSGARLDRLLARLATFDPRPCPPLYEVADGCHVEHVQVCPRCQRTVRLVRAGLITSDDLLPPLVGARPQSRIRVLALHLHPDGRRHRDALAREAGVRWFGVADDLLFLDLEDEDTVIEAVKLAAEVERPHRDHLRGVVVEGVGRWSRHGLLGPLVDVACERLRSRPWGTLDPLVELTEPLPAAPPSVGAWGAVAGLAVAWIAALQFAFAPAPPSADHPLDLEVVPARGGAWVDFDVDETAHVAIVRALGDELDVAFTSATPADKTELATGAGRYRTHLVADGVLVLSSTDPLNDVEDLLLTVSARTEPLRELAREVALRDDGVDARVYDL